MSQKHYEQLVVWEKGQPVVKQHEIINKDTVSELPLAAAALPYIGEEPEFEGKTNVEVVFVKLAREAAAGCKEARKEFLDRILGKPKLQTEAKVLTMNYKDFLTEIAHKAEAEKELSANQL